MSQAYAKEFGYESEMHSAYYPARYAVDTVITGASKTRQEFVDECDVNSIMERYDSAGVWPFKDEVPPVYLDFVGMPDLQDAMQHMFNAQEAFMRLPAAARKEFDNDPVRFVEYASNRDNLEQLRTWGLAEPEKAPAAPLEVRVVNPEEAPPIAPAKT